jgi:hypothetical protein
VGTTVSSINKTDRHGITEILLKVMLNTNTQTLPLMKNIPLVDDSVEDIIRDRPFNLQGGGYGFLFRSEFFFRSTQELEYFYFFCRAKREFFFLEFNIRLYDKNSESGYFFFPPPKSEYFFQQHWESEYFFRKKT